MANHLEPKNSKARIQVEINMLANNRIFYPAIALLALAIIAAKLGIV